MRSVQCLQGTTYYFSLGSNARGFRRKGTIAPWLTRSFSIRSSSSSSMICFVSIAVGIATAGTRGSSGGRLLVMFAPLMTLFTRSLSSGIEADSSPLPLSRSGPPRVAHCSNVSKSVRLFAPNTICVATSISSYYLEDDLYQCILLQRLRQVFIHLSLNTLFSITQHGMSRQGNDWRPRQTSFLLILADLRSCFKPTLNGKPVSNSHDGLGLQLSFSYHDRHLDVHQDNIVTFVLNSLQSLQTILNNLHRMMILL